MDTMALNVSDCYWSGQLNC